MIARVRTGLLALILTAAMSSLALAGTFSGEPPVRARAHSAFRYCPDPQGLESFTSAQRASMRTDALQFLHVSLALDLSHSERSWRSETRALWRGVKHLSSAAALVAVGAGSPATQSGYALIVRHACGGSLVSRSATVTTAPAKGGCEACRTTYFFVDRRAKPLIYFVYP
jgi:hypothetical protein